MPLHNSIIRTQKYRILVIVVTVLIAAATTALFHPNGLLNNRVQQTKTSPESNTQAPLAQGQSPNLSDKHYLVLEDWGVKFEIPKDIDEVKYYRHESNVYPEFDEIANDWYDFSTQKVEDLGGKGDDICIEPNDRNIPTPRLGGIVRSSKILPIETRPLNEKAIEGYYFYTYYGTSQSMCSAHNLDLQQTQLDAVHQMLKTISSSR